MNQQNAAALQQIMATQNIFNSLTPEQRFIAKQLAADQMQLNLAPPPPPPQQQYIQPSQTGDKIQSNSHVNDEWLSLLAKHTTQPLMNNAESKMSWIYTNGLCQWPDCHKAAYKFDSHDAYTLHLINEHLLDENSHGQVVKQMHLIKTVELELNKQKGLLNDMLVHLNNQLMKKKPVVQQLPFNYSGQSNFMDLQQQQQQQQKNHPLFIAALLAAQQQNLEFNKKKKDVTESASNNKENFDSQPKIDSSTQLLSNVKSEPGCPTSRKHLEKSPIFSAHG